MSRPNSIHKSPFPNFHSWSLSPIFLTPTRGFDKLLPYLLDQHLGHSQELISNNITSNTIRPDPDSESRWISKGRQICILYSSRRPNPLQHRLPLSIAFSPAEHLRRGHSWPSILEMNICRVKEWRKNYHYRASRRELVDSTGVVTNGRVAKRNRRAKQSG